MPHVCDMGQDGFYFPSEDFSALKNPTASAGFEPANLGAKGQHATSRPPKPLSQVLLNSVETYRHFLAHIDEAGYKKSEDLSVPKTVVQRSTTVTCKCMASANSQCATSQSAERSVLGCTLCQ
jgi:hypothetical protein